jgi:perosamine synthetase
VNSSIKPRRNIAVGGPVLDGNEALYVQECLRTNSISSVGRFVADFERKFAEFCSVRHAISTCNGTCALHLALIALGLKPGDEVIVPTLTYVATANVVRYCGGRPVLVDVDRTTFNIDPAAIEAKVGPRTRGIIAVHLYGHPAEMDQVRRIAQRHQLFVVEDASEAHGAEYRGARVGGLGGCAAFSFYGNKIVTTGEGGMVTTNDDVLADKVRLYRGQGVSPHKRYWFDVVGYNYRMMNLAAAIGLAQIERVDHHLARRRQIAAHCDAQLASLSEFVLSPGEALWARHAYWMYTVLLSDKVKKTRDEILTALEDQGIETRPVFYPMHQLPPYREPGGAYPNGDYCASRGICLPTHGRLTDADIERVCTTLRHILQA